jgi:epsilon-lactone hydrolase
VSLRRGVARWLVRHVIGPGLSPRLPLDTRRARTDRAARLLPLSRGVRRVPAGAENPGGEWCLPSGASPDDPGGAVLYVHGGGFVLGSPVSHRGVATQLARLTGVPVLLARYRLAPEHPFPAGLEDLRAAWLQITLGGARPVALAGDSAGGWLALALALDAGASGLPRPAGLALFSPVVDLADAESDAGADLMLPAGFVPEGVRAWRGKVPAADPRLDLFGRGLAGLPPLFIAFDHDEMLAAGARRLAEAARRAGVELRVEESVGLWHAWPVFAGLLPEADATLRNAAGMLMPGAPR